ncbi:hypothetical protein MBLNU459_g7166t1 [Dothideomycetes sp. NU459]
MLGRAAARALRAPTRPQHPRPHPLLASAARGYAKAGKPKATQFLPKSQAQPKPRPVVDGAAPPSSAATGPARQTSPGTSIPKDHTWKPSDAISFNAVPPSSSSNTTPTDQPGPAHPSESTSAPAPSEAANEEFRGAQSPESNTAAETDPASGPQHQEPPAPSGPLPDLRHGIPSTFDFEFGAKKPGEKSSAEDKVVGEDGVDAVPEGSSPFASGRRGAQDEQYDREAYETSLDKRRARLANYMYLSIVAMLLSGSAYLARPYGDDEDAPTGLAPEHIGGWAPASLYARVKSRMSSQVGYYTEPTFPNLLPEVPEGQRPAYTLVLSLEDLMIHSSWSREHGWRTAKRPGIDYFLRYLSQYYELVLFTSAPMTMADPIVKKLDPFRIIQWPLFREATKYEGGEYIKDLSYLNRPMDKIIMVDTKAEHAKNQPENAIIIPKWKGDPKDSHTRDLVALIPFLEYVATMGIDDTRKVIESFAGTDIPVEFARREAEARKVFNAQLEAERGRRPKKSLGGLFNSALGIKPQPGGMSLDNETTVAEGLAQGKMLSDQIRERGQREYERLEAEIQKNGAKWLKEMEDEEKKFMENMNKEMKSSWFGWGSAKGAPKDSAVEKRQE